MNGTNSQAISSSNLSTSQINPGVLGTSQSNVTYQIFDYAATNKHKTVLNRTGAMTWSWTRAGTGRWANTSAITSITLLSVGSNIAAGTTLNLYGIIA
jgi:hypothetical protein